MKTLAQAETLGFCGIQIHLSNHDWEFLDVFFFSYEELSEKKLFAWERLFDVVSKKINK